MVRTAVSQGKVHLVPAHEDPTEVVLPSHDGITGYTRLWDSAGDEPVDVGAEHGPGTRVAVSAQSMVLYRAHGDR
jgi:glycogen operon protein